MRKPIIAKFLKYMRKEANLTISDIQQRTGIAIGWYSHIERGDVSDLSIKVLRKLAELYRLDLQTLLVLAGYVPPCEGTYILTVLQTRNEPELQKLKQKYPHLRQGGTSTR